MKKYFRKGIFDRSDGWRLRKVPMVFSIMPVIMRTRLDSQNLYEDDISIEAVEAFIKEKREEIPGLSIMHVIVAATVRMFSQRPYLNRFVMYNKLYAHDNITISMAIKKNLTDDGEETIIKPEFEPEDTLQDVVRKFNAVWEESNQEGKNNSTDKVGGLLAYCPTFLIRFIVGILRGLDNIGLMPKAIIKASPWHSSVFITNVGSIGIGPIYHHLTEFGTCGLFIAMGKKIRTKKYDMDGNETVEKTIGIKIVTDERICDGYYYALTMKMFKKYMQNPELLLTPPEKVVVDDGVGKKRRDI